MSFKISGFCSDKVIATLSVFGLEPLFFAMADWVDSTRGTKPSKGSFLEEKSPQKGSFLEGKWDPGYFKGRPRLVKYYSIWPD